MDHRKNSYDFLRFCTALAVIVSHHFLISGGTIPVAFGEDTAGWALDVFFCLSGFLIYQSLDRSNDAASFFAARLTRIVPTLAIALVAVSVITLVVFSNYGHFIDHVKYIYRNAFLLFRRISDVVPGVFEGNPAKELNSPLWSLGYEIYLYVLLFAIMRAPKTLRIPTILGCIIIFGICWQAFDVNDALIPFTPIFPFRIGRLGSFFLAGAMIAWLWPYLERRGALYGAVAAISFLAFSSFAQPRYFLHCMLLATAIAGLGSSSLMSSFSKGGDASYGIYIFGWPVEQFSFLWLQDFAVSLAISLMVSIALGYAAWHGYEKRSIASRKIVAQWMRSAWQRRRIDGRLLQHQE